MSLNRTKEDFKRKAKTIWDKQLSTKRNFSLSHGNDYIFLQRMNDDIGKEKKNNLQELTWSFAGLLTGHSATTYCAIKLSAGMGMALAETIFCLRCGNFIIGFPPQNFFSLYCQHSRGELIFHYCYFRHN